MDTEHHTPSLTHLRAFTNSRTKGRPTHVAQDRRQVTAPSSDRIFAFAYERFLTGVIEDINNDFTSRAMERAVAAAPDRMRQSYRAAAEGMARLLSELETQAARRRQRNVVVVDADGLELVSLRIHLIVSMRDGSRIGALLYFSEKALTPTELTLMDTAVALAVRQIDAETIPAIIMVRTGTIHLIDVDAATESDRVRFLRGESLAYRSEWAASA